MKPARDWIALHGQSGEYPKVDEPIGCFTEAQLQEVIDYYREYTFLEAAEILQRHTIDKNPEEK